MIVASDDFIPLVCVEDGVNTVPQGWTFSIDRDGYVPPKTPSTHGLTMYGFNVLVKPKAVEAKIGSIYIPDTERDRLVHSITEGELVAVSVVAFTYETWPKGTRLPQIGDTVVYGKFIGSKITGKDGIEYRVMEDKEILAVRS